MPELDLLIRPAEPLPRALPANVEAEAAFLGAVLIDNSVLEELAVPLRPDHFFEPLHARIYERIQVQIDKQMLVNPVTVELAAGAWVVMRGLDGFIKRYWNIEPGAVALKGFGGASKSAIPWLVAHEMGTGP